MPRLRVPRARRAVRTGRRTNSPLVSQLSPFQEVTRIHDQRTTRTNRAPGPFRPRTHEDTGSSLTTHTSVEPLREPSPFATRGRTGWPISFLAARTQGIRRRGRRAHRAPNELPLPLATGFSPVISGNSLAMRNAHARRRTSGAPQVGPTSGVGWASLSGMGRVSRRVEQTRQARPDSRQRPFLVPRTEAFRARPWLDRFLATVVDFDAGPASRILETTMLGSILNG